MKKTAIALALGFTMTLAVAANAAAPAPGTYNSIDIGGSVQMGRGSQSWSLAGNAAQGNGDVFNYGSWDGSNLGAQWVLSCGASTTNQTRVDNRNGFGTGTVVYTTYFNGGSFFLSKNGPWGDGINDLTGVLLNTSATLTVQYVTNNIVARRGDLNTSGYFNGSNCQLTFYIANTFGGNDTDHVAFPANYPALLSTACASTRTFGNWTDIKDITIQIDCVTPAQTTTWSGVKALYK